MLEFAIAYGVGGVIFTGFAFGAATTHEDWEPVSNFGAACAVSVALAIVVATWPFIALFAIGRALGRQK
jgi:hypothetical protein